MEFIHQLKELIGVKPQPDFSTLQMIFSDQTTSFTQRWSYLMEF